MAKYKITKCPMNKQLVGTKFEAVIIKSMTLLNLVKKIASDVDDIKTRVTKLENRMDNFESRLTTIENELFTNRNLSHL
jgi:chaperonin cofactor prefoldin